MDEVLRDLNELLKTGIQRGASDVHVKVGLPPIMRIDGRLLPTRSTRATPAST